MVALRDGTPSYRVPCPRLTALPNAHKSALSLRDNGPAGANVSSRVIKS